MSDGRPGLGSVVISCQSVSQYVLEALLRSSMSHTSNDCEYQSCTFLMDGISFSPSGKSPSSWTRCAKRIGSSSERNWEARKRVPLKSRG